MFFLMLPSRQTRRTIWPGVSVNGLGWPLMRIDLGILPAAIFCRGWKAWKLVMMILACPSRSSSCAGTTSRWQRSFYAHLDAFLSAARSVPEIIQCCFGVDEGHPIMKSWFGKLPDTEQLRRHEFKKQFKISYDSFRALPLGKVRHISEHRTGVAPVKVH